MESAVKSPQCDHLRSVTAPYVFASEQAELIHINVQLSSLDRHIIELNTLRYTLHRRSSKLHNILSPIHAFPIEVLSYIFQLVVDPKSYSPTFDYYRDYLRQALVLSSVSSHFRCVALGTPELWKMIPMHITHPKSIGNVSSLLQHCIARVQNVTICARSGRNGFTDIENLLTCDVTRKVKAFHMYSPFHESPRISKLNRTSFPMIETLLISCGYETDTRDFDFGTLDTVTRLRIYIYAPATLNFPIIVPPSVQYLELSRVSEMVFVSLLYQCPNLVECSGSIAKDSNGPLFTKPLVLNHLKRLDTGSMNAFAITPSLRNLQLPSLEFLDLESQAKYSLVPFCCSVSATLTSLAIRMSFDAFKCRDVYALCRFTFPKLRVLKFTLFSISLLSAIHALSPLDGECNDLRPLHLPALKSISLYSDALRMAPRTLLDLLKNWWSDEALHLHLEFDAYSYTPHKDWTPGLREELRSVVGRRQIEIIWGGFKI